MAKLRLKDAGNAGKVARVHQAIQGKTKDGRALGPRGGKKATTAGGLLRKTTYFEPAEWQAIRRRAFEDESTAADVIRRAVRSFLDL
ncbi:MAG: hypothetical protein GY719_15515 [bacterium]|nr:hypothetical protein [bacterium]